MLKNNKEISKMGCFNSFRRFCRKRSLIILVDFQEVGMVLTNDRTLPTEEELTVPQEITLSTPWFKAVSVYMARHCEENIKEFILLRREHMDPRKTIKEAADVTACGIDFLKKLKKTCYNETKAYADCIDQTSYKMYITNCREPQRYMDKCVEENFGIERPRMGYFSKLHVHNSKKPKPTIPQRDYKAEAAKVLNELPEDYVLPKDYKKFHDFRTDWFKR